MHFLLVFFLSLLLLRWVPVYKSEVVRKASCNINENGHSRHVESKNLKDN